jgi:hypothetical protein
MPDPAPFLDEIGDVTRAFAQLGLHPVLVGGMALVLLGSTRVTRDFDFVVADPGGRLDELLRGLYDRDFELVSRLDAGGDVRSTIESRRVAGARLRIDAPRSAYFYKPSNGLRIDLLFDFPLPAKDLASRAESITVGAQRLRVASEDDLLRLKKLAMAGRSAPGDAQDVAFLEARRSR